MTIQNLESIMLKKDDNIKDLEKKVTFKSTLENQLQSQEKSMKVNIINTI